MGWAILAIIPLVLVAAKAWRIQERGMAVVDLCAKNVGEFANVYLDIFNFFVLVMAEFPKLRVHNWNYVGSNPAKNTNF